MIRATNITNLWRKGDRQRPANFSKILYAFYFLFNWKAKFSFDLNEKESQQNSKLENSTEQIDNTISPMSAECRC